MAKNLRYRFAWPAGYTPAPLAAMYRGTSHPKRFERYFFFQALNLWKYRFHWPTLWGWRVILRGYLVDWWERIKTYARQQRF